MSSAVLPLPISKEVRALALPWLACLACMVIPVVADAPRFLGGLSVPAYFLGAAALGAFSIGHEYTDRTLSLLLTMPARRERLFAIKLGVLAAMLLPLWFVAHTLVFGDSRLPQASRDMAALLPLLCSLFLAPWLTMACRNPIGGAVFALAIPGMLLVAGELIGVRMYGRGSGMQAFRLTFASFATIGLCAIGAVMGWRMFLRLEAIEGPGQDVGLPQWLRLSNSTSRAAPHFTRRNPLWLLVKKELRLHQLPLLVAGLYVLGWLGVTLVTTFDSIPAYGDTLAAFTLPYALLLPMLIGSSASARERQIGTLEWQVLLPMAAWKQWAVKVSVLFGLSLVLALGLPTVLVSVTRLIWGIDPVSPLRPGAALVAFIILLTSGSLYVSSLCRSGLSAVVMPLPATLGAWIFLNVMMDWAGVGWFLASRVPTVLVPLLVTGFIAIVLRFAFTNHRSADRPAARVWRQAIVMAAFVTAGVIMAAALQAFHR